MNNFLKIIAILFILINNTHAQSNQNIKRIDKPGNNCSRATGISSGLAEDVGKLLNVSISSVNIIRASGGKDGDYCWAELDTPKGPKSCGLLSLHTDGKKYWVGGMCL